MTRGRVHAELAEVVAGKKPGRTSDEEITIFDSTGVALEDVAAAVVAYERAVREGVGNGIEFAA
jgi:ornithine cyclodeaminase/alanine dehydrogenase-like protein (mu-crystallin family)